MNDLYLQYLLNKQIDGTKETKKYHPTFLDKNGEGITSEDELIKKLISTCEEGLDYSKE